MPNPSVQTIKEWLGFRTINLDLFVKLYDIPNDAIQDEYTIYQLKDLTMIHYASVLPAHVCFQSSGAFAFIRIYQKPLEHLSIKDIATFYGEPESIERSSAGKRAHYNVYAKEGFAFSSLDTEIHFMDIFSSMPTKEYTEKIYLPPGPFIR
jgi:hypothetical protein